VCDVECGARMICACVIEGWVWVFAVQVWGLCGIQGEFRRGELDLLVGGCSGYV
jgi:hypothetical protein